MIRKTALGLFLAFGLVGFGPSWSAFCSMMPNDQPSCCCPTQSTDCCQTTEQKSECPSFRSNSAPLDVLIPKSVVLLDSCPSQRMVGIVSAPIAWVSVDRDLVVVSESPPFEIGPPLRAPPVHVLI